MTDLISIKKTDKSNKCRYDLREAGRTIVADAPQLFIDVDIEADGVAGYGSMLSIGAVAVTGETFYSEIKPASEDFITGNRQFCEQYGLSRERLVNEAPEAGLVMNGFRQWLAALGSSSKKQPVFAAYNAAFDWSFVDLYLKTTGDGDNPFGFAPFDLKSLAIALNNKWDFDKTRSSQLPELITPETSAPHHALEDARHQQLLHFGMAALLGAGIYSSAARPELC